MRFGRLDISIKDYLGRLGPGITAVLSIIYKNKVYEGICWYTDEYFIVEINEELEKELGKIEDLENYNDIVKYLKETVANYEETAPNMKDILDSEE